MPEIESAYSIIYLRPSLLYMWLISLVCRLTIYWRQKVGHAQKYLIPTNNKTFLVFDWFFNLTNKSNLIGRLCYDLIRYFSDNLVVSYFLGHPVYKQNYCLLVGYTKAWNRFFLLFYVVKLRSLGYIMYSLPYMLLLQGFEIACILTLLQNCWFCYL